MDNSTARKFLIDQGTAHQSQRNPDALLLRLDRGEAPIPGQMTSVLLALKVTYTALEGEAMIDRELVQALYWLARNSRRALQAGHDQGVVWPPLLAEDLERVEVAVEAILSGVWEVPASQATLPGQVTRSLPGSR
ncbi:MAG: Dethiobiotin synthetase [Coleofasciculaceae cyanobacterium RL_1_1]|nr:Dethiobiotin synthetase [Coleofasciculaceae cyanobacterium RL_1_1]